MSSAHAARAYDSAVSLPTAIQTPATARVAPARRSRSRRGEGEHLRDEILAAAERILIETNDQAALSIRAIAAAVGVTPPSIYLHFADRNDLVFAVCERHAEHLEQAMTEAAAGVDGSLGAHPPAGSRLPAMGSRQSGALPDLDDAAGPIRPRSGCWTSAWRTPPGWRPAAEDVARRHRGRRADRQRQPRSRSPSCCG